MASGAIFQGFYEAPITFLPSYKYELGVVPRVYSNEKFRTPSFCDRILWKCKSNEAIKCETYNSANLIATRFVE